MDEIPVPEIIDLPSGSTNRGGSGRSPTGRTGIGTVAIVGALFIFVAAAAVALRLETSDPAGAQRRAVSPTLRPAPSVVEGIPEVLRHAWQRPYEVVPAPGDWGSGALRIEAGRLFLRQDPDAPSTSNVSASGANALSLTATAETSGCTVGDRGTYGFRVDGKGTVLTLTAIDPDACAAREGMLAGPWVRADLPPPDASGVDAMAPGGHRAANFDPFGDPASPGHLSYGVPAGWEVIGDDRTTFGLHHVLDTAQGQPTADVFIVVLARPAVAADVEDGAPCGPPGGDAPGVGHGADDIVRAITTRPGVVSSQPERVTIGGHPGRVIDLQVAPSWSAGCRGPDGSRIVGIPLLHVQGSATGPVFGIATNQPAHLVLLDVGGGRTLAVAVFSPGRASMEDLVAAAMPVIESFEFVPDGPSPSR